MFDIGWADFLVLILAGLFILGPERLPGAAAWLGQTVRKVKQYAGTAQEQLKSELGTDFDELRKPLADLRGLRDLDPRQAIRKHLFEAPDPAATPHPAAPSHSDAAPVDTDAT
jgi:sec-independent protein translocase protein TatB